MRLSFFLLILLPAVLFGAGTRASVRVLAHVPLVLAVDGPAQVLLSPGEVVRIRVNVSANIPWILSIHSPNAWVMEPATLSGSPGGATANSHDVEICCSSQASGPQTIALIYTLMPR